MPGDTHHGLLTADGRQPLVAVLDANPSTSAVAVMLAGQFGCRTLGVQSVEALLKLLKGESTIDLVLIDFGIGDMDPMVAAQLIRTLGLRGAMPLVGIASRSADPADSRARGLFAATVTKPYSPRELYAALDKSLVALAETAMSP